MDEAMRHEVVQRHQAGASIRVIAKDLGISRGAVARALARVQAQRDGRAAPLPRTRPRRSIIELVPAREHQELEILSPCQLLVILRRLRRQLPPAFPVVRVVLRTDRDMEYIHLKDYRGSGTEPVNVLSQYKFQDGLAYYESTRDTASHFFIDYLPKGNYVFEYATRIVHKGRYQTGFAGIQCMYAPEFNSHSESLALEVK